MAGSDLQQQVTQLIAALQAATVDELRQIDPRALAELGGRIWAAEAQTFEANQLILKLRLS